MGTVTEVRGTGVAIEELRREIRSLEQVERTQTQDALLSMLKTCLRIREELK